METINEAAKAFLQQTKIAVAGVSRTPDNAANLIYRKLRSEGYTVYAVNPHATIVEGDPCYPDLTSIPVKPEGVVIVTKPEVAENIVKECAALGITSVWMHRGINAKTSSLSAQARLFCEQQGIKVIAGGCPMMFVKNADFGHRIMRWMQSISGTLPATV